MITVLRIGHRIHRDKRVTTHVALVARAFSADKIYIDTLDTKIEETIKKTCERFGNSFEIKTGVNPKKIIKEWDGMIVHLTMYGENIGKIIDKINIKEKVLIIIGAEKMPPWVYQEADYNISVGNQPHSEVAALAIFLDRFTKGKWINKEFNGKMQIIPSDSGKKVVSKD
jgi:tRNA (cytidine56-2'-O)-methyltransferase